MKIELNLTIVGTSFLSFYIFTFTDYIGDNEFDDVNTNQGGIQISEDELCKYMDKQHISETYEEENNNLVNDDDDTNNENKFNYEDFFNLSKNTEYSNNLKNIFFNCDYDNDGYIQTSDLYIMLSGKGADDETINRIFDIKGISRNHEHKINYKQFKNLFCKK